MRNKETYKIALAGILLALSVMALYFAVLLPGVELSLFAVASVFVFVMTEETGIKGGGMLYVASSLLGLVLVSNKIGLLPYIMFFGIYAVVKEKLDNLKNRVIQWTAKISVFSIVFTIGYLFFKKIFFQDARFEDLHITILYFGAMVFFVLYDHILTLFKVFYIRRFNKRKVKEEIKLS